MVVAASFAAVAGAGGPNVAIAQPRTWTSPPAGWDCGKGGSKNVKAHRCNCPTGARPGRNGAHEAICKPVRDEGPVGRGSRRGRRSTPAAGRGPAEPADAGAKPLADDDAQSPSTAAPRGVLPSDPGVRTPDPAVSPPAGDQTGLGVVDTSSPPPPGDLPPPAARKCPPGQASSWGQDCASPPMASSHLDVEEARASDAFDPSGSPEGDSAARARIPRVPAPTESGIAQASWICGADAGWSVGSGTLGHDGAIARLYAGYQRSIVGTLYGYGAFGYSHRAGENRFNTPGGEEVASTYDSNGGELAVGLSWRPRWSSGLSVSLGVRGSLGSLKSGDNRFEYLPLENGECPIGDLNPCRINTGLSGLQNRNGTARAAGGGQVSSVGLPFAVGWTVPLAAGNLVLSVAVAPTHTFANPANASSGIAWSSLDLSGSLIWRIGDTAGR